MAEALLEAVSENLLSLVHNEFATISGIKGKAVKLSRNLELMKAVVGDAEEKQITNRSIKVWLQQLKDAVYVLDDMLDECSIESHRRAGLFSFIKPKNLMFRYEIGKGLNEIKRRFDEIAQGQAKFLLQEGVRERPARVDEWLQTSWNIPQPKVYGRRDDLEKIVKYLFSEECYSDFLSVYPIVGLGGMGKTTLCQMVYNDYRVKGNFNMRIWICVSNNFSVKEILCSIVKYITEQEFDIMDLPVAVIERKVQELLAGKRYLLVLDDVWNGNQQMEFGLSQVKWYKLKSVLMCGSKGSSILVSTRDMEVAEMMTMRTCQAHRLQGLSEEDCWLLLKQHVIGAIKSPKLVAIGKEIAKKCKGSPLAAQALGYLLCRRNEEKEWVEVMESKLWDLPGENSILQTLRLSYFHLNPPLRQCFAFCALFPKDTKIIKEDLIYLWMANGFISSTKNMEVEDVGNSIWNELYAKSFFQDVSTNFEGKTFFKMHDLVHDLAESFMGKECVILDNANITDLSANTHHVFYNSREELSFNEGMFDKVESLRTLYQFRRFYVGKYTCLPTHHTLRVLQTSSSNLSSLGSLIHLRYLELYEIEIKTLPDSIYSLWKLEILKLKSLSKLICLPEHLTRLQNLRHIVIEYCDSLSCMCPNIGKLSSLRTLSVFIVSSKIGHSLAELHNLKLRGDLHIKGLEIVGSFSEVQDANLKGKSDLHKLILSWGSSEETRSHATNPDQVLEGLQPHSNLKKLIINGYAGLKSPSWIGMLSNLVELNLCYFQKCMQLSSLGKLPHLRRLELQGMENMKYIDDDDESYDGMEVRAFPCLEELALYHLPKLEQLLKVGKGEMFVRLSDLRIISCPKLELPPCIPSLTSLYLFDYTNELLRSVCHFTGITSLSLCNGQEGLASFPVELFNNLNALEDLKIQWCRELDCLPEQIWKGFRSLRTFCFSSCEG